MKKLPNNKDEQNKIINIKGVKEIDDGSEVLSDDIIDDENAEQAKGTKELYNITNALLTLL